MGVSPQILIVDPRFAEILCQFSQPQTLFQILRNPDSGLRRRPSIRTGALSTPWSPTTWVCMELRRPTTATSTEKRRRELYWKITSRDVWRLRGPRVRTVETVDDVLEETEIEQ